MQGMRGQCVRSTGLALMSVLLALPVVGWSQKTLLSVPWGKKPSQTGLINHLEKERCGPLSFCESGGQVFLLDSVNQRLLRGGPGTALAVVSTGVSGTSLCADGSGGVWVQDGTAIERFDAKGARTQRTLLKGKAAQQAGKVEGYGVELQRAPDGAVGLRSLGRKTATVAPPNRKVAANAAVGAPAAPALSYRIKRMNGNAVRILGFDGGGKALVSVNVRIDSGTLGAVLFKGTDDNGNLYVELERIENGRAELEVHRYSPAGKRLRVFQLSNDYFTTVYKKTEVEPDGSVIQMRSTPDGVQVIQFGGEAK